MGQIMYHKLSAEITGHDGREWIVSVEPPFKAEGEVTQFEVTITRIFPRNASSVPGLNEACEPFTYKVPSRDGMFFALNTALSLVPSRMGND